MRPVEFVVEKEVGVFSPEILLIDCADLSMIKKNSGEESICELFLKNGIKYRVYGTYRCLTNRFFHALNKKINIYDDLVSRPSIMVFHHPQRIECDSVFFDPLQIKAFIFSLDENFNLSILLDEVSAQKIESAN